MKKDLKDKGFKRIFLVTILCCQKESFSSLNKNPTNSKRNAHISRLFTVHMLDFSYLAHLLWVSFLWLQSAVSGLLIKENPVSMCSPQTRGKRLKVQDERDQRLRVNSGKGDSNTDLLFKSDTTTPREKKATRSRRSAGNDFGTQHSNDAAVRCGHRG